LRVVKKFIQTVGFEKIEIPRTGPLTIWKGLASKQITLQIQVFMSQDQDMSSCHPKGSTTHLCDAIPAAVQVAAESMRPMKVLYLSPESFYIPQCRAFAP
jgi:hypothetical protein